MLLFLIGLVWFFTWGALIYLLVTSCSSGSFSEQDDSSESNWIPSSRALYPLSRGSQELTPVAAPAGPERPMFYAACSGAGTIRTFETSTGLLRFLGDQSLSSWAVFKRSSAHWWAIWRRVDLRGHMSTSEIEEAIWET